MIELTISIALLRILLQFMLCRIHICKIRYRHYIEYWILCVKHTCDSFILVACIDIERKGRGCSLCGSSPCVYVCTLTIHKPRAKNSKSTYPYMRKASAENKITNRSRFFCYITTITGKTVFPSVHVR